MTIPKIIHQLWIGTLPPPSYFMEIWRVKHPDFQYILWNEENIEKLNLSLVGGKSKIDEMQEICGKADIYRWYILYLFGGIFIDADSICIERIDDVLLNTTAFATYENEKVRRGLVAVGTMGFTKNYSLCLDALEWIRRNNLVGKRAWQTTGPVLLTNLLKMGKYKDMTIFPSYFFLPVHHTGEKYDGHHKVYSHQLWGSTKNNYCDLSSLQKDIDNSLICNVPTEWVSVLVASYNTKLLYLLECLDSIRNQTGHFGIELVWINDGSDAVYTEILENSLNTFAKTTRYCKVIYKNIKINHGLSYCLNKGVLLCSNELIFRMDSDDIMMPNRIARQLEFMKSNPDCVLCGAQVNMIKEINGVLHSTGVTSHRDMDINTYKQHKPHWIMNHPTFCFRKSKIIEVGNYNDTIHSMCEDFELILRVLKKYGKIYNIQEPLLYYRLHDGQVTYGGGKEGSAYWSEKRNKLINDILMNSN